MSPCSRFLSVASWELISFATCICIQLYNGTPSLGYIYIKQTCQERTNMLSCCVRYRVNLALGHEVNKTNDNKNKTAKCLSVTGYEGAVEFLAVSISRRQGIDWW